MRQAKRNQELLTTLRSGAHSAELPNGATLPIVSAYHTVSGVFIVVADGDARYHQHVSTSKGDPIPSVYIFPTTVC